MKVLVIQHYLCPHCSCMMLVEIQNAVDRIGTVTCTNSLCQIYGKQFNLPTVELEEVKEEHADNH